jgi:coenzyme F420-reducing hydrogenase beta subunit
VYPKVDNAKCIKCNLCIKVCPIINKTAIKNEPSAYACINKDETIRVESSSGGLFTLIAEQIIDKGGIVFGAGFDENFAVSHSFVEAKDELDKFRGSKYVQSIVGDTYKQAKEFLLQGREVLFTGTPCQIGGLKSFLQQDYENLFCIDIVCHGVPSPKVWQNYISYQESRVGALTRRIAFRCKDKGWKRFSISFIFENNMEYRQTLDKDLYMKAFLKDICLRPSCYACEFKTLNRESDITLADFWGIENLLPEMDDDKGTSLIFINSKNGQSMLKKIKDQILYNEIDINKAVSYNSAAIKSAEYNPKKDSFFEELDKIRFDKLVRKYCSNSIYTRIKMRIKLVVCVILKKTGLFKLVREVLRKRK